MSDLNLDKILNIYNYFDGIMITDEKGVIKYYTNFRTDVYSLQLDQIVGKNSPGDSSGTHGGAEHHYAGP